MDFSEMLNNIFGEDWVKSLLLLLSSSASIVISVLFSKFKNKLTSKISSNNTVITEQSAILNKILEQNKELREYNKTQEKEIDELKSCLLAVGDIVANSFLGSKAVSTETKIKISKSVDLLSSLGLDINAAKVVAENAKASLEVVENIKETVEEELNKITEQAEDTKNKSLDIYNKIINDEQ